MESILISIPHQGNIRAELVGWIVNTIMSGQSRGQRVGLDLNGSIEKLDCKRNESAKKILDLNFDYLLSVDSDIVPPPETLEKLLAHNKKIIGALCYSSDTNGIPYPLIMKKKEGVGYEVDRNIRALMEVDAFAIGCSLIHRSVFEKIKIPFRYEYDKLGKCLLSEDFHFCEVAKKSGYKIYVDTSLQCSHFRVLDLYSFNRTMGEAVGKVKKYEVKNA